LYFFYIACVTLHPLPCLQLFIAHSKETPPSLELM
jgi:hypothetical protein